MLTAGLLASASLSLPASAQSAGAGTSGSARIEEPARARVAADTLRQMDAVLTVVTSPGDVSSISVPASVEARMGETDTALLATDAVLLDSDGGVAPAGLSVSIGEAGAGPGGGTANEALMLILVQFN